MIRALFWLLALLPMISLADPTESAELLAHIRHSGQAQFRYQETRLLEFASEPWHGQGYMLSGADGSLVKLQLQPTRVIMVIAHQRMYYWDPEQQQRHSAALDSGVPGAEQITVFRAILQGRAEELQSIYDFASEKQGKHWSLRMTPKPGQSDANAPTIEISGDEDDKQRQITLRQPDGESTEYRMVKTAEDQASNYSLPRLLQEAIGD